MLDSALIGGHQNKTKEMLNSLNKTYNLYIGLKLPDLSTKDTMEENSKITKETLSDYKKLIEEMKKQQQEKNA
jgi:Ni,Fe-hydrogenase maturation factor